MEANYNILSIDMIRSPRLKQWLMQLYADLHALENGMYQLAPEEKMAYPSRFVDGSFLFHPVVYIDNDEQLIITNSVTSPHCWGFCGPNQQPFGPDYPGIDGRTCEFTPYSQEAALICNKAYSEGLKSWTITAPNGVSYKVKERTKGVFTQINQSNPSLVRSVARLDFDTAKRLIIEKVLKEAIGADNAPLLYPLLNGNLWRDKEFPVEAYDELLTSPMFADGRYTSLLEQMEALLNDLPTIEVVGFNAMEAYTLLYSVGLEHSSLEDAMVAIVF